MCVSNSAIQSELMYFRAIEDLDSYPWSVCPFYKGKLSVYPRKPTMLYLPLPRGEVFPDLFNNLIHTTIIQRLLQR